MLKEKIKRFQPFLIAPRGRRHRLSKLVSILWFLFCCLWKIVCNTMLYMIFQYDWKPVLIKLILTVFEALLKRIFIIVEIKAAIAYSLKNSGRWNLLWNCHWHVSISYSHQYLKLCITVELQYLWLWYCNVILLRLKVLKPQFMRELAIVFKHT